MGSYEKMAENLKSLRAGAGMTQKDIADRLGVHQSSVLRWENGTNIPDVGTMLWYADHFDVSLDWLFGRKRTIRGSFRDLLAKEVGEAISESFRPGTRVYSELLKEIDSAMEAYGCEKDEGGSR